MKKFTINAEMWIWNGEQGSWHFVYVGDKESAAIKKLQEKKKKYRGFGAVKVKLKLGKSEWATSIFPTKEGPYILPIKASVRTAEGVFEGDRVKIVCELI